MLGFEKRDIGSPESKALQTKATFTDTRPAGKVEGEGADIGSIDLSDCVMPGIGYCHYCAVNGASNLTRLRRFTNSFGAP